MSESGRSCRKVDRRAPADDELTVKVDRGEIVVEQRGRRVRVLRGAEAERMRAAIEAGDDVAVQRLIK